MPTKFVRPNHGSPRSRDHDRWSEAVSKDLFREDHDVAEEPLWWWILFTPGKMLLWLEYMFPTRIGGVFGSARRIRRPIIQIWYSLLFYFFVIVAIILIVAAYVG